MPAHNIVYKTLGFKWLIQTFCPALAFVSADRNEARNPQRFIHVTVVGNARRQCSRNLKIEQKLNRSDKNIIIFRNEKRNSIYRFNLSCELDNSRSGNWTWFTRSERIIVYSLCCNLYATARYLCNNSSKTS